MITVKQFAEERGITIQAVHQSMNGKRKKDRLEGHVHLIDGVKWLDEEAVVILDEARQRSPIVYEKEEANEVIKMMEENEKLYLRKIAEQADTIAEQAKWKADNALAIAQAGQTQLLLDNTKAELENLKNETKEQIASIQAAADKEKTELHTAFEEELQSLKEQIQKAEQQLQAEKGRRLTFRERLTGRKKKSGD